MPVRSHPGLMSTRLQDASGVGFGSNITFQTKGQLEPGRLVTSVRLILDAIFTQPGAGAVAIPGELLYHMLLRVNVGRRINITGPGLRFLDWMTKGRSVQYPGSIPAVVATSYAKRVEWEISYVDPLSRSPYDGAVPTELFDEQILVALASNGIFAATVPTMPTATATLRCYVDSVPSKAGRGRVELPASYVIADQAFSALNAQILVAGQYEQAALFTTPLAGGTAGSAGRITSANVATVNTRVDGRPLVVNSRAEDLASLWNRQRAFGSTRGTSAPVYSAPPESIDDQPEQAAAGAQSSLQMEYIPLVFPPAVQLAAQVATAQNGLAVDLTGTLGPYVIAYRVREPRGSDAIAKGARKLGLKSGQIRNKAASASTPVDADLAPFLPKSVEGSES